MHDGHVVPEGLSVVLPSGDKVTCEEGDALGGTISIAVG